MEAAILVPSYPLKHYRLRDGTLGTEYQLLQEWLKDKLAKRQFLDDEIEELQQRLPLAEGAPR